MNNNEHPFPFHNNNRSTLDVNADEIHGIDNPFSISSLPLFLSSPNLDNLSQPDLGNNIDNNNNNNNNNNNSNNSATNLNLNNAHPNNININNVTNKITKSLTQTDQASLVAARNPAYGESKSQPNLTQQKLDQRIALEGETQEVEGLLSQRYHQHTNNYNNDNDNNNNNHNNSMAASEFRPQQSNVHNIPAYVYNNNPNSNNNNINSGVTYNHHSSEDNNINDNRYGKVTVDMNLFNNKCIRWPKCTCTASPTVYCPECKQYYCTDKHREIYHTDAQRKKHPYVHLQYCYCCELDNTVTLAEFRCGICLQFLCADDWDVMHPVGSNMESHVRVPAEYQVIHSTSIGDSQYNNVDNNSDNHYPNNSNPNANTINNACSIDTTANSNNNNNNHVNSNITSRTNNTNSNDWLCGTFKIGKASKKAEVKSKNKTVDEEYKNKIKQTVKNWEVVFTQSSNNTTNNNNNSNSNSNDMRLTNNNNNNNNSLHSYENVNIKTLDDVLDFEHFNLINNNSSDNNPYTNKVYTSYFETIDKIGVKNNVDTKDQIEANDVIVVTYGTVIKFQLCLSLPIPSYSSFNQTGRYTGTLRIQWLKLINSKLQDRKKRIKKAKSLLMVMNVVPNNEDEDEELPLDEDDDEHPTDTAASEWYYNESEHCMNFKTIKGYFALDKEIEFTTEITLLKTFVEGKGEGNKDVPLIILVIQYEFDYNSQIQFHRQRQSLYNNNNNKNNRSGNSNDMPMVKGIQWRILLAPRNQPKNTSTKKKPI